MVWYGMAWGRLGGEWEWGMLVDLGVRWVYADGNHVSKFARGGIMVYERSGMDLASVLCCAVSSRVSDSESTRPISIYIILFSSGTVH